MATPAKTAPTRPQAPPVKQAARPSTPPGRAAAPAPRPQQPVNRTQAPPARPSPEKEKPMAVATRPESNTAVTGSKADLPAHIRAAMEANGGQVRGSESVEMQDLVIPRVELVQALSKCLEEGSAEYIEGARPGMLFNSVTRLLYGAQVLVCPVYFRKQYLAWKDRKKGGGFGGAFDSIAECNDRISQETDDGWEPVETAQQIVLVVDSNNDYECSEAVISMARTKMKVSRQWNSLIRVNGFDRFSRMYEVFGVDETNATNDSYKNFAIRYVDWAPVTVYKQAEVLYNSIAGGTRAVKIDDNYEDVGTGTTIDGSTGAPVGEGTPSEY